MSDQLDLIEDAVCDGCGSTDVHTITEPVVGGFLTVSDCQACKLHWEDKIKMSYAPMEINYDNIEALLHSVVAGISKEGSTYHYLNSLPFSKKNNRDNYIIDTFGTIFTDDDIRKRVFGRTDTVLSGCILLMEYGNQAFSGDVKLYSCASNYPKFREILEQIHPKNMFRSVNGGVHKYHFVGPRRGLIHSIIDAYYENDSGDVVKIDTTERFINNNPEWFVTREGAERYIVSRSLETLQQLGCGKYVQMGE